MYFLSAAGVILGLPKSPWLALCFAFLLQITINPASGMSVSFILSYSALAGILTMSGPILNGLRRYLPPVLGTALAASLAAFIATMSVTAGFFGTIRLVGIVCGLLMGPLSTVFMVGALFFPAVPPFLRPVMDWAMGLLSTVMEKIVVIAGHAPPVEMPLIPALLINAALAAGLIVINRYITRRKFFLDRKQLEL
jgi:competence protein ComEC